MKQCIFFFMVLPALCINSGVVIADTHADTMNNRKATIADTQTVHHADSATDSAILRSRDRSRGFAPIGATDTSVADSMQKAAIRDSLMAEKSKAAAVYQTFPVSPDAVHGPVRLPKQKIFSSGAINISDLARMCPQMAAVPFSLSNNLNRFMPYGFPLPGATIYAEGSLLGISTDAFTGSDRIASTQLSSLHVDPLMRLCFTPSLDEYIVPETHFLWENGAFVENILNVRFARALSSNLNVGLFSNHRYFKSGNFSIRNDIKSLFEYFITDSNRLWLKGKNPLVEDQNTELCLFSNGKNGARRYLSLSYHDEKNELSYEKDTTDKTILQWDRVFQYGTVVNAGINGLRPAGAFLDVQARVVREGHTRRDPAANMQRTGRNNEYSFAVKPYLPFRKDTAFIAAHATRYDEIVYDNSKRRAVTANASINGVHHFQFFNLHGAVSGGVGRQFLYLKKIPAKNDWTASLSANLQSSRQSFRAFALRDCAPYPLVYDSIDIASAPAFFDLYESYGAEYSAGYKKIGVTIGTMRLSGLSGDDDARFWPNSILPYRQPTVSFMVSPAFGEWKGLSLTSRWLFSDTRPFIKAQTVMSYTAHPLGGKEHILLDIVYDYWSVRDAIPYGGSNWNNEINNLSLSLAVQIKTFNLFYKINNILNRKFAYVPGYRMPGLSFRWGFQWLIQG